MDTPLPSEPTPSPSAPAADAGPVDTASIASRVIQESTAGESKPDPTAQPSSPANGAAPPADTAGHDELMTEARALLAEMGWKSPYKPDGRKNYIPYEAATKIMRDVMHRRAAALVKAQKDWESERDSLRADAEGARQFRALMQNDPQAVLRRMAEIDPRYAAFLQAQTPAAPAQETDPEPGPDVDLGNGRATYSVDGLRRREAWAQRRMERAFEEKLKPYAAREQALQQQAEQQRAWAHVQERSTAMLTKARTWPGWNEHEADILKVLQDDSTESEKVGKPPQKSMMDAYLEVVVSKLTANHNSVRQDVMKELNTAPRSTSVPSVGPEPTRGARPRTTQEIARAVLARAERNGG